MPAQATIPFISRYRYYSNFTGEPDVLVGYKGKSLFNIAGSNGTRLDFRQCRDLVYDGYQRKP